MHCVFFFHHRHYEKQKTVLKLRNNHCWISVELVPTEPNVTWCHFTFSPSLTSSLSDSSCILPIVVFEPSVGDVGTTWQDRASKCFCFVFAHTRKKLHQFANTWAVTSPPEVIQWLGIMSTRQHYIWIMVDVPLKYYEKHRSKIHTQYQYGLSQIIPLLQLCHCQTLYVL